MRNKKKFRSKNKDKNNDDKVGKLKMQYKVSRGFTFRQFVQVQIIILFGSSLGFLIALNTMGPSDCSTKDELTKPQNRLIGSERPNIGIRIPRNRKWGNQNSEPTTTTTETAATTITMATGSVTTGVAVSSNLFITPAKLSRLGNLIFQYAVAYGVARTVGKRVHMVESDELLWLFPALREHVYVTESMSDIVNQTELWEPKCCMFEPAVIETSKAPANIVMNGYFQSWRYFDAYRHELRAQLRFNDLIQRTTDDQLAKIRTKALSSMHNSSLVDRLIWVAVHIRRGDMVTSEVRAGGFDVASADYLRRSAWYLATKYRGAKTGLVFLVFSEDLEWSMGNFHVSLENIVDPPQVHVEFVLNKHREIDLSMMVRCNATIMTVGTFGWWAAYLSGGETFYYAFPYIYGSDFGEYFTMSDYYLPEWRLNF